MVNINSKRNGVDTLQKFIKKGGWDAPMTYFLVAQKDESYYSEKYFRLSTHTQKRGCLSFKCVLVLTERDTESRIS